MSFEYPSPDWSDYELVDCGGFEKLERFGQFLLARPEPKALWDKALSEGEWNSLIHTRFTPGAGFGKAGKEDSGTWSRTSRRMNDQWEIRYRLERPQESPERSDAGGSGGNAPRPLGVQGDGHPQGRAAELALRLGLTSFKHVGVFPEQAPNWEFIYSRTKALCEKAASAGKPVPKVLNLFAYTGAASLAAKAAGADVTHLDSVRQVVTWARDNMERSSLDGIRWVVEDAMKFAQREARRAHRYSGIILDPPAYGHGPDGEKWKLDECLFDMLRTVAQILEPDDSFLVLNLYSNGYSAMLGETLVREAFGIPSPSSQAALGDAGVRLRPFSVRSAADLRLSNAEPPASPGTCGIESGELVLRDRSGRNLPLSIFVRLER